MMKFVFLFTAFIAWKQRTTRVLCSSPRVDVILYQHGSFRGTNLNITFADGNNCYNLPEDFRKQPSSANAFTPVMLCAEINCGGKKSEVTGMRSFLNSFNDRAVSVLKLPLPQPAILYDNTYYSGNHFNVTFSTSGETCENLPDNFANTASSVIASRPVVLFTKPNCQGESFNVTKTVPDLKAMSDRAASVLKEFIPPAATLYNHVNYGGRQVNVTFYWNMNCVNLPENFYNEASSIKVFEPVALYTTEDCEGGKWEMSADSANLGRINDKAVSVGLL